MQVAEAGKTMIDRHHHHVTESGQLGAVKPRCVAGAGAEAAAMKRYQHSALLAVIHARGPHVQRQAILAHAAGLLVPLDHHAVVAAQISGCLWADLAMPEALTHAGPRGRLLGGQEAVLAACGSAIRNTLKLLNPGIGHALYLAGIRLYHPKEVAIRAAAQRRCGTLRRRGILSGRDFRAQRCSRDHERRLLEKTAPAAREGIFGL